MDTSSESAVGVRPVYEKPSFSAVILQNASSWREQL